MPVHNLGHPVRLAEISDICTAYNIPLIEDAAESVGSRYRGVHTGRFGLMGIFSFNGNKIITTGGGGAINTDDADLARLAKHYTTTAKQDHPWLFLHDEVGFNYRLPNINAALGCGQLEQLNDFVKSKRDLAKHYQAWFGANSNAEFISEPDEAESNYWLNAIIMKDKDQRDLFLHESNSKGLMTRPLWTVMSKLKMYQDVQCFELSNTNWFEDRVVNIPSSCN